MGTRLGDDAALGVDRPRVRTHRWVGWKGG